uniref:HFM1, ATP-dependent DNA helicase homolog n=1 Tax=Nannospalax galili TaxID=1026970 RepID=A0A8C6QTC7_NANGA
MLKSSDCFFPVDNLFFSSLDENFPVNENSLDWFLSPAPLISEIPDTQELEEEIESYKQLGQEKMPKMFTSNLKIINEDTNCISPTQKFQCPSNVYKQGHLNLGGSSNSDLPHAAGKLVYGSSQKYKIHFGTEIAPTSNIPDDIKLVNVAEDKGEETSAFRKRLFKICDNIRGCDYANDSVNLDSHIGSAIITPTKINKGKSWNNTNNKQTLQYSTSRFMPNDTFSASEIGEDIFKVPSFSVISRPHDIQGLTKNDLSFLKAVTEIPTKFRSIFKEFPYFNYIQSKAFDDPLYTYRNFVICAPTGSGKTVLFELAITRLLMEVPLPWLNMKIVYSKISTNLKVFEIQHANIIITTPVSIIYTFFPWKYCFSLPRKNYRTLLGKNVMHVASFLFICFVFKIAEWLSDGERPAVCLKMDESHRPVKLKKVVLGFPCSSNQTEFKFDLTLNYKIYSVIRTYSDEKPTLVFCATRKGVQQAASVLVKDAKFTLTMEQKQRYSFFLISFLESRTLKYHLGEMRKGLITLVTTSTLAMGVNLPAHLVIIKSTLHYAGGIFEEYSETDILQMIGRAGRPQFDTTATAVIMTRLSTREKYVQMLACNDTVESSKCFISGLNKDGIEAKLQELCLKNLKALSSLDLIKMDEDVNFKPTEAGRLMAWYYITFETVKKFCKISGKETLSDLISMLSSCNEFLDVQLRVNEKRTLNTLNKDPNRITIRFPMEGRIKTREMKVNCLIQAQLGCIPIQDFALTQDTSKIFRNGSRIARWLSDFIAAQEKKFAVLLNSLILAKCFKCKLWENSQHVSKQLDKIGISLSNTMVNAGLTSFKKIEETSARELELILSRHPPFGTQIKEAVMYLPKYEVEVEQVARYSDTKAEILVTVILRNFKQLQTKRTAPDFHYATLIIGDADNQVIFKHKIMDSALLKAGNWAKKIDVKRAFASEDLSINLISSDFVGLDIQQKFAVFYLGPKWFGNQTVIQRKSETEISHSKYSDRSTIAGSSKGTAACKKPGNRECNHHCKNKHTCGHDCCKIGVAQKSEIKESAMSSYLSDLRSRNAVSTLPPVKRLKVQMNKSQNVDLKEFCFTPRPSLPSISRSEYLNIPELPILEQWNQHEVCGKVQQKPSEYGDSEVLNVNFELGDEVWEDFDDESLLEVTSFSNDTEKMTISGFENTMSSSARASRLPFQESKSKFQRKMSDSFVSSCDKPDIYLPNCSMSKFSPSSVALQQPGNASTVNSQERKQMGLSPVIERLYLPRSKKIPNSDFKEVDIFVGNSDSKKEIDLSRYYSDNAAEEMKAFLGIFDDVF